MIQTSLETKGVALEREMVAEVLQKSVKALV
jgi:hypothetical protein